MVQVRFDEQGLVPVIVQDVETNEVLTLAYMNQESLTLTLKDRLMTFYSRSRQELWRKGETSGNYQHLVSLTADCDQDALVAKVKRRTCLPYRHRKLLYRGALWYRILRPSMRCMS